ncbi:MAG: hypothetical protein ACQETE_01685 [Bacteroidota bacterium]
MDKVTPISQNNGSTGIKQIKCNCGSTEFIQINNLNIISPVMSESGKRELAVIPQGIVCLKCHEPARIEPEKGGSDESGK